MMMPSSDSDSPLKTGPNDIQYNIDHPIWRRSPDPLLSTPDHFGYYKRYRAAINILYSDSESPPKMGLDASSTTPIGGGHQTLFPIPITDLSILGATMRISNFPLQIWNLLKKWVQVQVESSKSEEVTQPAPGAPINIWGIAGLTHRIRHFRLQIHNLLEKSVQEQVEPSKLEEVKFLNHQCFVSISHFTA